MASRERGTPSPRLRECLGRGAAPVLARIRFRGVLRVAVEQAPLLATIQHTSISGPELAALERAQGHDVGRSQVVRVDVLARAVVVVDLDGAIPKSRVRERVPDPFGDDLGQGGALLRPVWKSISVSRATSA